MSEPQGAEAPGFRPSPNPTLGSDEGATGEDASSERPEASEPENKRKQKKFWRELAIIVVAAAVLTLLVKAFVVQVYRIPSESMENTLLVGDRVLVNKVVYHFRGIDRGDVIVFSGQGSWGPDAPPPSSDPVVRVFDDVLSGIGLHSGQTYYIKRVIGLPGDRVACCTNGKVTVNGVALEESSYLFPGAQPSNTVFHVTVPAGRLWVMGDNRGDSDDSRNHWAEGFPGLGTIPENEVVGRAFLVIWPPSQFKDLPIPDTFKQQALGLGQQTLGVVAAAPVPATAGAAALISTPLLLLRHRRRPHRRRPHRH